MFGDTAREKVAGQVRAAAEAISQNVGGVLLIAIAAIAIASGALYVAIRALQAARPAAA